MQLPLSTSTFLPSARLALQAQRQADTKYSPVLLLHPLIALVRTHERAVPNQVAITDAPIRRGMLLLRPEHVVLLGGEVMLPS